MAFYEQISEYTYRLTVCQGYNSQGKKLRKRKTIKVDKNLTPKQIEKELNEQMILFERQVNVGTYLDGEKITFEEFTKIWLRDYGNLNLAPATLISYTRKLEERVLPAIGHIKIAKIQPVHILQFYQNLKEANVRLDGRYSPVDKLCEFLKPYTASQVAKTTGISFKTCQRLIKGCDTNYSTASKLCKYFNLSVKAMFNYQTKNNLSEKSIRGYIGVIGSILSTAVKWNVIMDNPVKRVDMKKVSKRKVKYYDDAQILDMLQILNQESLVFKTIVYLTLDTGLRRGEVTGLCWEDIDFENSKIHINKQRHYVMGYGTIEGNTKSEAGDRVVTVSQTVIKLLKAYKLEQNRNRLRFGSAWIQTPYVFVHEDGKEIGANLPYIWFTKFLKKNNLPKITFHQLRHTNASILIASGEDVATVSGRLGHSDKNITLNIYTHLIKSKEAQVANKMDEFYAGLKVV